MKVTGTTTGRLVAKARDHLDRAPIREALIDLQVRAREATGLLAVQELARAIDGYQVQGPIMTLQTRWSVSPERGAQQSAESKEIGVRLHLDQRYVLQLRINGLTLSRLEPYETWDNLMGEARRVWEAYCATLKPEAVTRVATRYINLLKLPMAQGEHFEEYLAKPPQVPEGLPQGILGFVQRVVLLKPDIDAQANVIQLLQEGPAPLDHVPIVMDIDAYKKVEMLPDTDEVWALLGKLRAFKNEIFFAHLTEKAVGLFE